MSVIINIEQEQRKELIKKDEEILRLKAINKIRLQDISDLQVEINQLNMEKRILKKKNHNLTEDLMVLSMSTKPKAKLAVVKVYQFPDFNKAQ